MNEWLHIEFPVCSRVTRAPPTCIKSAGTLPQVTALKDANSVVPANYARSPLVVEPAPKLLDGNPGTCSGSGRLGQDLQDTLRELTDLVVNPGIPSASTTARSGHSGSLEDNERVDRLWELRLCIETLGDSLDTSGCHLGALGTKQEELEAVEEILRRIAELGLASAASRGRGRGPATGAATALHALSRAPPRCGRFTECVLGSGLGVSGLLEAVLGELTDWQSQPCDAERRVWRQWDVAHARLAINAGVLPVDPSKAVRPGVTQGKPVQVADIKSAPIESQPISIHETCCGRGCFQEMVPMPMVSECVGPPSYRCGPLFGGVGR